AVIDQQAKPAGARGVGGGLAHALVRGGHAPAVEVLFEAGVGQVERSGDGQAEGEGGQGKQQGCAAHGAGDSIRPRGRRKRSAGGGGVVRGRGGGGRAVGGGPGGRGGRRGQAAGGRGAGCRGLRQARRAE